MSKASPTESKRHAGTQQGCTLTSSCDPSAREPEAGKLSGFKLECDNSINWII